MNFSRKWANAADLVADAMVEVNADHDGRKAFVREGGSAEAKAQIALLDGLRKRFEPFVTV